VRVIERGGDEKGDRKGKRELYCDFIYFYKKYYANVKHAQHLAKSDFSCSFSLTSFSFFAIFKFKAYYYY